MLHAVWHFLIANGLWASVIAAVVAVLVAWLVGLVRWGRAHFAVLVRIVELLDTERPGGLTDLLDAIKEKR